MPRRLTSLSHTDLIQFIHDNQLGSVDSREWRGEWQNRWVVFADLIAFAARAKRSKSVVLNNIIRFDRASSLTKTAFPNVRIHRFSDSTFGISDSFGEALGFGIGLQHSCLAMNTEYLQRASKKYFIHLIVPRITIAQGQVLVLPDSSTNETKFNGIDPASVIAGEGIVNAYYLEKFSAGGLITFQSKDTAALSSLRVRGGTQNVNTGVEKWIKRQQVNPQPSTGNLLRRGDVIDFPWLLMRPMKTSKDELWCAEKQEIKRSLSSFFEVWKTSDYEFYSSNHSADPLDVSKHCAAAIRQGIQSAQILCGNIGPNYATIDDIAKHLHL